MRGRWGVLSRLSQSWCVLARGDAGHTHCDVNPPTRSDQHAQQCEVGAHNAGCVRMRLTPALYDGLQIAHQGEQYQSAQYRVVDGGEGGRDDRGRKGDQEQRSQNDSDEP